MTEYTEERIEKNIMDPDDLSDEPDTEDTGTASGETLYEVGKEEAGERLDVFLSGKLQDRSRSFIRKLIEDENVSCAVSEAVSKTHPRQGFIPVRKAGQKVKVGQVIHIILPEVQPLIVEPENIPLDILYEDNDLIVVNKPKGMVVHPAAGHYSGTLVNALLFHCGGSLSGINGVLRPGIVHRIDKDTTGSLVIAKNDNAHRSLAEQLRVHSITRRYRAIVMGNLKTDEGVIDVPVARHPADRMKMAVCEPGRGKDAVTHWKVLERFRNYTYVECRLETGRTHQIRVHMAHIGHPLLGDTVYGPSRCPYQLQGQTLHAMVLGFQHPSTGAYMEFTAPLPEYFEHLLKVLRERQRS